MKEVKRQETNIYHRFVADDGEVYETTTKIVRQSGDLNGLGDAIQAFLYFGMAGAFLALIWVCVVKVSAIPQQQPLPVKTEVVWQEQKR